MAETKFVRVIKNKNYTIINNTFLKDLSLSWKAKGVMAYFLSLPDDWEISFSEIEKHATDGRDSLRAAIKELKNHGYLIVDQKKVAGKFAGMVYTIVEEPSKDSTLKNPSTGKPLAENPSTGKPLAENPKLLNTNKQSTNKLNTKEREESSSDDFTHKKADAFQNEQNQTDEEETAKPKVVRHKYGQYQNVLLSDEQYQSLVNKHGPDKASWLIERLSEYIASSGRTYKNYLVTLNGWVLRAWEEEQKHNQNNNNNRAIINSVRNSLYGGMPDSANNDNSNDDNTFYF